MNNAGYPVRLTRNQQAVLDGLSQQTQPISAQALYSVLRQQQAIGISNGIPGTGNSKVTRISPESGEC